MNITGLLSFVYNQISANAAGLGLGGVYKHHDGSEKFQAPAVFCELGETKPNDDSTGHIQTIEVLVVCDMAAGISAARDTAVSIVEGVEAIFNGDFGSDEYPPDLESVKYDVVAINGEEYYIAEIQLTTETD